MRKCKIFFTAFILLMTLFILSVEVSAADTTIKEGRFYYEVVDGEAIIRKVSSSGIKNLVIPETLGGYPVTEINMENYAADIKSKAITLPKTLKRIGNVNKEHYFEQLYVDSIETWLTITENSTIYGIFFNTDFYVDGKIVTDIVIPDSKTEINTYAFHGLKINSVTFSESIQSVSSHAFDASFLKKVYVPDLETWFRICNISTYTEAEIYINNEKPVDIVIPENIDTIPGHAFEDFKIKSITFTTPIKHFGNYWVDDFYMVDAFYVDSFETWMDFDHKDYPLKYAKCLYIGGEAIVGDYVFPETCTRITRKAFSNYKALKSITLHSGIEHIGDYAFADSGVENVYVDSLETWFKICDAIYESNGCATVKANPMYSAKNLYVAGELLVDLVIPESITEIPVYGLYNVKSIKSVTFHNGVMSAGYGSFKNCTNIKEVYVPNLETFIRVGVGNTLDTIYVDGEPLVNLVIPEGVTYLHENLFRNYDKLESITFKHSGISIGAGCFTDCDNLKDVYADSFDVWFGINFEDDTSSPMTVAQNLYINGSTIENLVFDESVTEIPDYVFKDCKSIKTVTLHDKITSIGKDAFMGCSRITEIYSPSLEHWLSIDFLSIESNPITADAKLYIGGELLEELRVPESIKDIKNYAFYGYKHLKAFYVNGNSLSIYSKAFGPHCSDMSIYAETLEDWLKVNESYHSFSEYETLMDCGATLYIAGEKPVEIIIPDTVKKIPWSAFQGCKSIRKITIPATTSVGKYAFKHSGLREIVYGSLTEKTAPVMVVDGDGLEDCILYEKITFGYGVKSVSKNAFKDETNLKEVVFLNGIEEIGDYAFYKTGIKELTLPSSLKTVGKAAFYKCPSLVSVTFGDVLDAKPQMEIGASAFYGCKKIENVTFNSGADYFNANAFCGASGLKNIYINDLRAYLSVRSAGDMYYSQDATPMSIGGSDRNVYLKGKLLENLVIPEGVTTIYPYAFYRCKTLESVKFPSTLKEIHTQAFSGCSNLKDFVLPESLEFIGDLAFFGCKSITSVNFGTNLKRVELGAFESCKNIKVVYMYPEHIRLAEHVFLDCENIQLVLYTGTEEAWKNFLEENRALNENQDTGLEGVAVFYRFRPESLYAPEAFKAIQTADSITLAWSSIKGVTGYRIYVKNGDSWKTVKTVKNNTYKVTGLTPGTKYTFAVKAYINTGALVLWSPEQKTLITATKAIPPSEITATQTTSTITLNWSKSAGATGYRVYQYSPSKGKYVKIASIKGKTTYTKSKNLKAGSQYKFKIKPYIKLSDGTVIWGKASDAFVTATECKSPSITSVTSPSKSKATVKWTDVSGETGYQLYYSTSKDGTYKKISSYGENVLVGSKAFSDSASGRTIYFKVRAYSKVNGQTIFSSWSAVKSVKLK